MSPDLDSLIRDLASEVAERRLAAAQRLAELGETAAPAAIPLIQACVAEDETSDWASSALESLGPPPVEAASDLTRLLTDPRSDVGFWAATLLGRLGPQAATAAGQALQECASSSPHAVVRKRATWALEQIGGSG